MSPAPAARTAPAPAVPERTPDPGPAAPGALAQPGREGVPEPGECHVWLVGVRHREGWLRHLDTGERRRVAELPAPAAAAHLTSRAAQRLVAARYLGAAAEEVRIERGCGRCGDPRHGRPRIAGAPFDLSVSHTDAWVLVAVVGAGLIGVDLEPVAPERDYDALTRFSLTPAEAEGHRLLPAAERPAAFVRAWTRKEAAMKLTGHGLAAPPCRIDVSGPTATAPAVPDWPRGPLHLAEVAAPPGHRAAACTTVPLTVQHFRHHP